MTSDLLDRLVVDDLLALDGLVPADLFALYLGHAEAQCGAIATGIGRGNRALVGSSAHTLAGGSLTIGALCVGNVAAEIEAAADGDDLPLAGALLADLHDAFERTRIAFDSLSPRPTKGSKCNSPSTRRTCAPTAGSTTGPPS